MKRGIKDGYIVLFFIFRYNEGRIISEALKTQILSETDMEILKRWLKLAGKVATVSEFEEKM